MTSRYGPALTRPGAYALARELRASGAWSLRQIRDHIEERGVRVSLETIHRWVDDSYRQRVAERDRRGRRRRQGLRERGARIVDDDAVVLRVMDLHEAGLDVGGIRIVIKLDMGLQVSGQSVRHVVETGALPDRLARLVRNRLKAKA